MIASDLTRVQFSSHYSVVFLDADELFAMKSIIPPIMNQHGEFVPPKGPHSSIENHTMASYRDFMAVHFNNKIYREWEQEIHYYRFAATALLPSRTVQVKYPKVGGNNYDLIGDCMHKGKLTVSVSVYLYGVLSV